MIDIVPSGKMHKAKGRAAHGTLDVRWDFSFDSQRNAAHPSFGRLKAFSDGILSPSALEPLHREKDTEVVTYVVDGEFRHFDERGHNGILKKGWIQHICAGRGIQHAEINNLEFRNLRFVELRFLPDRKGVTPRYQQKPVQKRQRRNRLLPLVSNRRLGALKMCSDAEVFASFLEKGKDLHHTVVPRRGLFLYVLEGGPLTLNGKRVPALSSAEIYKEPAIEIRALKDAELLLVDVRL
jgi:redox-sensitive bicupin YhaK (pirin superfamily)